MLPALAGLTQRWRMPETTASGSPEAGAAEPERSKLRDPAGTRRRILAAALQEFSAKGIDGARVDAIAERAGTNKRMLYYYFGSKDDLFRAVLRQRLADRAPTARERDRTGPGRIAELQDRLDDSADYVRLLMWEGLERRGARARALPTSGAARSRPSRRGGPGARRFGRGRCGHARVPSAPGRRAAGGARPGTDRPSTRSSSRASA